METVTTNLPNPETSNSAISSENPPIENVTSNLIIKENSIEQVTVITQQTNNETEGNVKNSTTVTVQTEMANLTINEPTSNKDETLSAEKSNKTATENKEENDGKTKKLMAHIKALMGMHYMKNDGIPAEVLPGFYLGSVGAAFNRKLLEEMEVKNILCCCSGVKEAYPNVFKYRMLNLLDKPDEDITRYFEETADYIHEILNNGQKVLIHCFAGKSRSTTIMISYLVKYKNMSVEEALALIRTKRALAQPNMGFLTQLRSYEKKLRENLNSETQA